MAGDALGLDRNGESAVIPKQIVAQRDFSGGEYNSDAAHRDDSDVVKAGARQLRNWRILNSGAAQIRPGRRALFPAEGRVDNVLVSAGISYYLCFGDGTLKIRDTTGAIVAALGGFAWTTANLWKIVWTVVPRDSNNRDVVITYVGQRPWIARWTSPSTWTILPFTFALNGSGGVQGTFYRLAPPGITLQPSAVTGTITLTTNADYFTPAMVGMSIRWIEHQIRIIGYTDARTATGFVVEQLPLSYDQVALGASPPVGTFSPGEIVEGANSGTEGEVVNWNSGTGTLRVNLKKTGALFIVPSGSIPYEQIVGPNGSFYNNSQSVVSPQPSILWDEEVASNLRGWPGSCFYDQSRLGFCDHPAVPGGVAWSGIGVYDNFYVAANPNDPMFEIAPLRARVYHVVNKSDELVFTDRGIFYIPISETNPLKPGSVAFKKIRADAATQVKPAEMSEGVAYLNVSMKRVVAVIQTGSITQPWDLKESSLLHSHLFTSPVALMATTSETGVAERYVYAVNSDGSVAVGKVNAEKQWVGWLPWDSGGVVKWLAQLDGAVTITSTYTSNSVPVTIAEVLDTAQYIDGSLLVNAVPTAMQAGVEADFFAITSVATPLGNMTSAGALAIAFDGMTNEVAAICPQATTPGGATTYGPNIGSDWGVGVTKTVTRFTLYAPTNDSFITGNVAGNVKLQGSANASSWTDLTADIALPTTTGATLNVQAGITITTAYRYHRVIFASGAALVAAVAQVQFFTTTAGAVHKSPSLGTGALWWLASGTADLMDGVMPLGTHSVDASGNIVKLAPGEDLTSATLVAGKSWTATLEPFVPRAQPGQSQHQRMTRRRVSHIAVSVLNSTGFVFGSRRIPPWNQGDDESAAPIQREKTYSFRPSGRSHDPRLPFTKDVPGPLTITEISMEVTV